MFHHYLPPLPKCPIVISKLLPLTRSYIHLFKSEGHLQLCFYAFQLRTRQMLLSDSKSHKSAGKLVSALKADSLAKKNIFCSSSEEVGTGCYVDSVHTKNLIKIRLGRRADLFRTSY